MFVAVDQQADGTDRALYDCACSNCLKVPPELLFGACSYKGLKHRYVYTLPHALTVFAAYSKLKTSGRIASTLQNRSTIIANTP